MSPAVHPLARTKALTDLSLDQVYVIYGPTGTGKTVLASTFPKTKEKPLLYVDILEGGTASISPSVSENIVVAEAKTPDELDEILDAIDKGYFFNDETKVKDPAVYSTIVFDSATQLEFMLKESIMKDAQKDRMSRDLWGLTRQGHDQIWNLCKYLHMKTGSIIVILAQQRDIDKENNPSIDKVIPAVMPSAAFGICAKASFVWFTNIEDEVVINPETNRQEKKSVFITYIDAHPTYLSKCRKPPEMVIPLKVKNLTYPKFKKNVLDKLEETRHAKNNA